MAEALFSDTQVLLSDTQLLLSLPSKLVPRTHVWGSTYMTQLS